MKITVDRSRCIGSGLCAVRLPTVFEQDDDEGLVELLDATGAGHSYADVSTAEFECPAQAISVTDATS